MNSEHMRNKWFQTISLDEWSSAASNQIGMENKDMPIINRMNPVLVKQVIYKDSELYQCILTDKEVDDIINFLIRYSSSNPRSIYFRWVKTADIESDWVKRAIDTSGQVDESRQYEEFYNNGIEQISNGQASTTKSFPRVDLDWFPVVGCCIIIKLSGSRYRPSIQREIYISFFKNADDWFFVKVVYLNTQGNDDDLPEEEFVWRRNKGLAPRPRLIQIYLKCDDFFGFMKYLGYFFSEINSMQ